MIRRKPIRAYYGSSFELTLRFHEGVAEVSMVPPHLELAPALVLASWTGLVEVP